MSQRGSEHTASALEAGATGIDKEIHKLIWNFWRNSLNSVQDYQITSAPLVYAKAESHETRSQFLFSWCDFDLSISEQVMGAFKVSSEWLSETGIVFSFGSGELIVYT